MIIHWELLGLLKLLLLKKIKTLTTKKHLKNRNSKI